MVHPTLPQVSDEAAPAWRRYSQGGQLPRDDRQQGPAIDRRRYHAARTIEAFSTRLRQRVGLDALTRELLAVVDETMQPTQVALWLRP